MSILIKGIDMPKKGTNIVLTIYGRDGTYDAKTYPNGPRIKAEAIQIPKDHGRIGDIDSVWNDEGGEQFYDEPILLEREE